MRVKYTLEFYRRATDTEENSVLVVGEDNTDLVLAYIQGYMSSHPCVLRSITVEAVE